MASNDQLLTHSHKVVRAKKRQKQEQVKAVVFDDDARREFLTGFHKRKLAKKEESKKKAQAREKQERLEARREQRRVLAEQAAQNAAKVEEAYGGFVQTTGSEEEWNGIASSSKAGGGLERAAEYSDEERLATVTVVEDFDPSTLIRGTSPERPEPPPPRLPLPGKASRENGGMGDVQSRESKRKSVLAKKVRYETKAARKATQAKQRERRTEKAERAGGKAARKRAGRKKRR
ncbi:nucleolar protein 12-domain-containing protein [Lactifluus subvellereus]|nr:nucleolar protein 12-domain-containing protein [Lactifluus subvellereus]